MTAKKNKKEQKDKKEKVFKHRFGFRTGFSIYLIGFFALVITALWLMQDVYVNNFNEYVKIDNAKMIVNSVQKYLTSDDAQVLIKDLAQQNDVCIEIVKKSSSTKMYYYKDDDCILKTISDEQKKALLVRAERNEGSLQAYFMRSNGVFNGTVYYDKLPYAEAGLPKDFVLCKKWTNSSADEYYILVNSTIAPLEAAVANFRAQLGYLILGISVFFVIIAIYITVRFSKPIENINREARNLVRANYNVHFKDSKSKELGELSQTLNYVARELAQSEEVRREFIANVSHDLRTPLMLIGGYAEAIKDMPESCAESADVIIEESKRLSRLVNDMLDLSVLQSGQYKPNFEQIDITELVGDIIKRLNKFNEIEGTIISFEFTDHAIVNCDETKISQVIYNLLSNAIKFSNKDKKIDVVQSVTDNMIKIEVIDHGIGIDADVVPHIFERYYKDKKTQVGTGLGLSIVKAIVEMHGGQCGVTSEKDIGSLFWFILRTV